MGAEAVEVLVPLGQPAVEDRGVGDQHGLVVVGRGEHRLAAEPQHDLGTVPAKNLGQGNAGLERVEEPAVGHVQVDPEGNSQDVGGLASLGQPDVRAWRVRGRLAIGQVDDAHRVALAHQPGQRSAAGNLDVVGMRPTAIRSSSCSASSVIRLPHPSERPQRLKFPGVSR